MGIVLENISHISAGPRDPEAHTALAIEDGSLEQDTDSQAAESENDVIVGEYDDPPEFDIGYSDAEIIDVQAEPITPDDQDQPLPGQLSGPPGRELMSLQQANEAAARMRDMRRR